MYIFRLIYKNYPARSPNMFSLSRLLLLGLLFWLGTIIQLARAETITIGKGAGVIWEGLPFNTTMSGPMVSESLSPLYGMLAISKSSTRCMVASNLTKIAGFDSLPIAPGVGLIPRATGIATYQLFDGKNESLSGTLGIPSTEGIAGTTSITSPSNYVWCLPPRNKKIDEFYDKNFDRIVSISGSWVMVADGNQMMSEINLPEIYAATFATPVSGDRTSLILPSNIILRISTLECFISTPTEINFGTIERNTTVNSELASQTHSLNVACSQGGDNPTERIDANINLQFYPISGLYESNSHRLALNQGGGYITGEINKSITGSGICNLSQGIPFDNTRVKVGEINQTQSSQTFNNQVTWRLCSGGASLPTGPVTAAADVIVTFN